MAYHTKTITDITILPSQFSPWYPHWRYPGSDFSDSLYLLRDVSTTAMPNSLHFWWWCFWWEYSDFGNGKMISHPKLIISFISLPPRHCAQLLFFRFVPIVLLRREILRKFDAESSSWTDRLSPTARPTIATVEFHRHIFRHIPTTLIDAFLRRPFVRGMRRRKRALFIVALVKFVHP